MKTLNDINIDLYSESKKETKGRKVTKRIREESDGSSQIIFLPAIGKSKY